MDLSRFAKQLEILLNKVSSLTLNSDEQDSFNKLSDVCIKLRNRDLTVISSSMLDKLRLIDNMERIKLMQKK